MSSPLDLNMEEEDQHKLLSDIGVDGSKVWIAISFSNQLTVQINYDNGGSR